MTFRFDGAGLRDIAAASGGKIIIPTGALCGLDAVKAAAEGGNVKSVVMQTRKPPASLPASPSARIGLASQNDRSWW